MFPAAVVLGSGTDSSCWASEVPRNFGTPSCMASSAVAVSSAILVSLGNGTSCCDPGSPGTLASAGSPESVKASS